MNLKKIYEDNNQNPADKMTMVQTTINFVKVIADEMKFSNNFWTTVLQSPALKDPAAQNTVKNINTVLGNIKGITDGIGDEKTEKTVLGELTKTLNNYSSQSNNQATNNQTDNNQADTNQTNNQNQNTSGGQANQQ